MRGGRMVPRTAVATKCIILQSLHPHFLLIPEENWEHVCQAEIWPIGLDKVDLGVLVRLPHHKVAQAAYVGCADEDVEFAWVGG